MEETERGENIFSPSSPRWGEDAGKRPRRYKKSAILASIQQSMGGVRVEHGETCLFATLFHVKNGVASALWGR